jgi:N-acetylneuraminate epimerase
VVWIGICWPLDNVARREHLKAMIILILNSLARLNLLESLLRTKCNAHEDPDHVDCCAVRLHFPGRRVVATPFVAIQRGVRGGFAGVSNGALLVAGGANFPDKKPWQGGKKVWYDDVFVLANSTGKWVVAGKLPRPLGYGVSVTHANGVVCVGGSDSQRHYADAFRMEWRDGKLVTTELPSLPKPLANSCGALINDTPYIAGGQEKSDSTNTSKSFYRIDLSERKPKWEELEACPGDSRMLALAASCDGAFWFVGGVDLV